MMQLKDRSLKKKKKKDDNNFLLWILQVLECSGANTIRLMQLNGIWTLTATATVMTSIDVQFEPEYMSEEVNQ